MQIRNKPARFGLNWTLYWDGRHFLTDERNFSRRFWKSRTAFLAWFFWWKKVLLSYFLQRRFSSVASRKQNRNYGKSPPESMLKRQTRIIFCARYWGPLSVSEILNCFLSSKHVKICAPHIPYRNKLWPFRKIPFKILRDKSFAICPSLFDQMDWAGAAFALRRRSSRGQFEWQGIQQWKR